ncbi:hypothetical protein EFV37_29265 [Mesorhizobium loti]|uniref:Uncharacterized protein n=1 Tax=Mesorhizobium jarvisii TaxID=1777867 RepID=A0A6M7TPQ0_9HYPH|nr:MULTISPECIES: hypothetical protein [Mesorhizobium]OBQ68930.1 hypothetical protein A9K72_12120 [Mesorhizobium loti]QKC65893.1 hypothetical protein EB229_29255 [Mesorhizobium jarvisii]QKD11807.1 hypothetical protein EFV37_29265 [Mesorhizobium loti]RJT37914.1 hypothetical protein D3242_01310 [Mesorhizobium jarvisii]
MVYGCDGPWWKHRKGLPDFHGLKICWASNGLEGFPDIRRVKIAASGGNRYLDDLQMKIGTVGAGGNSGFQALNLAVQFGAKRILLVGFDMTDRNGIHWYGRNTWHGANNPNESNFRRWIEAFDKAAPVLSAMGVQVINTFQGSAMRCFPRRSIEDMLAEWQ